MKTIFLAADHAGYALKEKLRAALIRSGVRVTDLSPKFKEGDDYPAIGNLLAKKVARAKGRGVLVCGSGEGVAIAANRVPGARAVVGHSVAQVKKAREHNDMNILCLSGWKTGLWTAMKLTKAFTSSAFSGAARHKRRIKQLG